MPTELWGSVATAGLYAPEWVTHALDLEVEKVKYARVKMTVFSMEVQRNLWNYATATAEI